MFSGRSNGGCKVRPRARPGGPRRNGTPVYHLQGSKDSAARGITVTSLLRLRLFPMRASIQVRARERAIIGHETSRFFDSRESASVSPLSLPVWGWHKRRRKRERDSRRNKDRSMRCGRTSTGNVLTDIAVALPGLSLRSISSWTRKRMKRGRWRGGRCIVSYV